MNKEEAVELKQLLENAKKPYANGYTIAGTVDITSIGYKLLAALVAGGGVIGWFWSQNVLMLFAGLLVAAIIFGAAVIIGAVGATLRAVLDTAVHTRAALDRERSISDEKQAA